MPETRLRGQETTVKIAVGNQVQRTITAVKEFSFSAALRVLSEGYLGETTMRKDDIFDGVKGQIVIDLEAQDYFLLQQQLAARAKRQVNPNSFQVNITTTFAFPNGNRPRIVLPDVKFGELPVNVAGRDQYVNSTLPYECEDFFPLTT